MKLGLERTVTPVLAFLLHRILPAKNARIWLSQKCFSTGLSIEDISLRIQEASSVLRTKDASWMRSKKKSRRNKVQLPFGKAAFGARFAARFTHNFPCLHPPMCSLWSTNRPTDRFLESHQTLCSPWLLKLPFMLFTFERSSWLLQRRLSLIFSLSTETVLVLRHSFKKAWSPGKGEGRGTPWKSKVLEVRILQCYFPENEGFVTGNATAAYASKVYIYGPPNLNYGPKSLSFPVLNYSDMSSHLLRILLVGCQSSSHRQF